MKLRPILQDSSRQRSAGGGAAVPSRKRPLVEAIEPRRLYSADLHPAAVVWTPQQEVRLVDEPSNTKADTSAEITQSTSEQRSARELVIVDGRVPDLDALLEGLAKDGTRDFDVVILDTQRDGLAQITEALAGRHDLTAVHVIGHGQAGAMDLGSTRLDADTLARNADAAAAWGRALGEDGDLLLYGCDVAAGDVGANFIAQLSSLTGADVAASTDVTGAAARGGNWTLEAATGRIDTRLAVNAATQSQWQGTLSMTAQGGQVLVNADYLPGTQLVGAISFTGNAPHTVGMDAAGNYVVVWTSDAGEDGDAGTVFMQRYNAAGVAQGANTIVNVGTVDDQTRAQIVMNATGQFAVMWERYDPVDTNILIRMFDNTGTPLGGEFHVDAGMTGVQADPTAVMDAAGNVAVFWTRNDGASTGIYGNYVEPDGTAPYGPWLVNTTTAGAQLHPSASMNAAGEVVVVWEDAAADGSGAGIYGQRYLMTTGPGDINPVGGEFRINQTTAGDQERPSVSVDGSGAFVVTWQSDNAGPNYNVFARRFDASGTALGNEFQVNTDTASNRYMPTVAARAGGGFVVAWVSTGGQDGTAEGVYMRQFDIDGTALTGEILVNSDTGGTQTTPSVVMAANGNAVVVWDGFVTGDVWGIGLQRYTSSFSANTAPDISSNGGAATASINVAENATAVTTVTATDAQVPATQTLAFSITGGADAASFSINSTTGVLVFQSARNFESPADTGADNTYEVIVQVSDGAGGTDTQTITVTITNVNEAPVITSNGGGASSSVSVAENGTAVTTATATDVDAATTFTYSINGGADAALFSINATTGVLTFLAPPNFEAAGDAGGNNVYDVIVQVSDGTLTDTQAIAVTVTNVNEAPVISSNGGGASASVSVAENTTAVTTATATDVDASTTLTYSISGGADAALFGINSTTGVLTFLSGRNFEAPADAGGNNVYDVIVQVSDGTLTDTQAIAVTVTDANEAPVITSNGGGPSGNTLVAENTTAVTTVTATDVDASTTFTYSISGGADSALFSINSTTGVLTFLAPPNFEAAGDAGGNNVYDVIVQVSDGTLTDTQAIAVTVTNTNEAPVITSNAGGASASVSVAESTTAVTTATATDVDASTTLTYSISGGADAALFGINSTTGVLTFMSGRNFEAPSDVGGDNVYDVIVQVSDGTLTDTQAIAVTVTDANEAPVITSNGGGPSGNTLAAENTTAVTTVTATDVDASTTFTYSISGGADSALFSINSTTGVLTFLAPPNFEAAGDAGGNNVYDVIVQVSDGTLTDTQALAITVYNANEAPVISSNGGGASASVSVAENTTAVTTATATDVDASTTLTYSISGGADAALFGINSTTGVLTFLSGRNFEAPSDVGGNNVYDVIVQVSDGTLTDTQAIAITVTNANEAPVITSNGGGASASVNLAENNTAVTTATATDVDAATTFTYSISGGADAALFSINATTGVLTFLAGPDFDAPADVGGNNVYDVIVQVSDGTLTDTQAIAVTVTGTNELPNITSNGGGPTAGIVIAENTTAVTTVVATDPDAPAQTMTYSITGGADAALFTINASTGALSFLVARDYEVFSDADNDGNFLVTVQVSDGVGGLATQALTVAISDVNEAPVITSNGAGPNASINVNENTTAVTTVAASDPDLPTQTLTYSLVSGNDVGRFSINASTGVLSFVALPDFEAPADTNADNVYELVVQVTDGNGGTDTQAIYVTVAPVDEAPVITSNGGGASASVNVAENTTVVTTAAATDFDVGATLTYSISGGADAALFSINSATGALTFLAPRNFEAPADAGGDNVYDVIVQVSDGTLTDTQAIAVTVTDTNEAPVITSNGGGASASVNVAETTSAVTTVTATDADAPAQALAYSISGGADAARFTIDAATGVLSFLASPDFELPNDANADGVYLVVVMASDGNGGTATQTISVSVTDTNEAPVITSGGGGASASITVAPYSTAVVTMMASDVDMPAQPLSYSISGGVDAGMFTINAGTGLLSFVAPQDGNAPADANGDGIYHVTVLVSDGNGGTRAQALSIRVQASGSGMTPGTPGNGSTGTPVVVVTPPETSEEDDDAGDSIDLPTGPAAGADNGGSSFESELLGDKDSLSASVAAAVNSTSGGSSLMASANGVSAGTRHANTLTGDGGVLPIELLFNEVKLVAAEQLPLINSFAAPSYSSGRHVGDRSARDDAALEDEDDDASPTGKLSLMQIGSIAAAFGTAWWAMRASGILVSLLASTPAWRNFDPLPVLGNSEDEAADDEDNDPRLDDSSDPERRRDEVAAGEMLDASEEH